MLIVLCIVWICEQGGIVLLGEEGNPPADSYEREADRVAGHVMDGAEPYDPEKEKEYEKEYEKRRMSFLGVWVRTAIYVNGGLQGGEPSILAFAEDGTYYSKSDLCMTSGTYEKVGKNRIKMVMQQNGCPGNLPLPFTVTNTFSIEKDKDGLITMTMVTGPVTETYMRQ
ncbi:MAG: hypothetical protein MI748_06500 [Opitutales bacterium]|nr:hypothetical protein [Opitutales bacterium]